MDKIKRLEYEIGRYRKKVSDQDKILREQNEKLMYADLGNRETQMLVDAVLTAAVLRCGEEALDPDTGEKLGWRLSIPAFSEKDLREKYEIHARRTSENGGYMFGVSLRENGK